MDKETLDLVIKKLELKQGDEFVLRHHANENQNLYSGVVFNFDGENVFPLEITSKEIFWVGIVIGRYIIEKYRRPVMIESPDLSKLKRLLELYMDDVSGDENPDEDYPHWIFESVLETFFGKEVWDYINSKIE
jgi:hypothetical protein